MGTKHVGAGFLLLGTSWASAQTTDLTDLFLQINGSKFSHPSDAVFVDKHLDALVSQQNDGKVVFFKDGKKKTVLDLPVAGGKGNGLLDIALAPNFSKSHGVYLYYTPALRDGGAGKEAKLSLYQWNPTTTKLKFVDAVSATKLTKQGLPASEIVFDARSVAHVMPTSLVNSLVSSGSVGTYSSGASYTANPVATGSFNFGAGSGSTGTIGSGVTSGGTVIIGTTDPTLGTRDGGAVFTFGTLVQVNSGATFQIGSGTIPLGSTSTGAGVVWNTGTITNVSSGSSSGSTSVSGGQLQMSGIGPVVIGSGGSGTMIPASSGSAGVTLLDTVSAGSIGSGSNDLILVSGDITVGGDALFRVNNLNPTSNFAVDPVILNPVPIVISPADPQNPAFQGSFTLVDLPDDPSSPGFHIIDVTVNTFPPSQLGATPTPEPTSGAILLAGAGALMKRGKRDRSKRS